MEIEVFSLQTDSVGFISMGEFEFGESYVKSETKQRERERAQRANAEVEIPQCQKSEKN